MKIPFGIRPESARYIAYAAGFALSVAATLIAYLLVVHHVWPMEVLVYLVLAIAVMQLAIQAIFFLHIGSGSKLKLVTFAFAILIVLVIVVGSIWIMNNLDYNMMRMTPDQMELYMHQHEGI